MQRFLASLEPTRRWVDWDQIEPELPLRHWSDADPSPLFVAAGWDGDAVRIVPDGSDAGLLARASRP